MIMKEEKKVYAWIPSNCDIFYDTYNSIEEAVAEAQEQWDEKYEYYEEENTNNTSIVLMTVSQFNPETYMGGFGEELIERLQEQLDDFTGMCNVDSEIYCSDKTAFNKAVKEVLMPVIKEHLSFHLDQVGHHLTLTYDVETRKYTWEGNEFDEIPEVFKSKEETR